MKLQSHIKQTILQAILIAAGIFLGASAHAQHYVAFKGKVIMPSGGRQQVSMTIADSTDTMQVEMRGGRFEFFIPTKASVVVTVSAPGHLTKQITIDTHMAGCHEMVEFDVQMEKQPEGKELCYEGPVGSVQFTERERYTYIRQSKIDLNETLVTASR